MDSATPRRRHALMLEAVLGAWLFAAGVLVGWKLSRASSAVEGKALERLVAAHEDVVSKLFMVRGLHPHLAAPAEFSASGISRRDAPPPDAPLEAESVDNVEEEDDDIDKFEKDMSGWWKELDEGRNER